MTGLIPWISPVDQARMGNTDIMSRMAALEIAKAAMLASDIVAATLSEVSTDTWDTNTSNPYICQGRLSLSSSDAITTADYGNQTTVYFTPFKGNQIALFNGSTWYPVTFGYQIGQSTQQLTALKLTDAQTGTTTNAGAGITGLTDTSQLIVGMEVSGTGVPDNAKILTIDSPTQITMSVNATASGSVAITFKVPNNRNIDVFAVDAGGGVLALRMVLWNPPNFGGVITGATNATPIVITATSAHGVPSTDSIITQQFVQGNTAANGTFRITFLTSTTYQLKTLAGASVAGNGIYTAGGEATQVDESAAVCTRASAIDNLQDGIYTLASDRTWRYLGTVRTGNTSGNTLDNGTNRFVWNYYNRTLKHMSVSEGTANWTYAGATWRPTSGDLSNRLEWIVGMLEDNVNFHQEQVIQNIVQNIVALTGITLNSPSAAPGVYIRMLSAQAAPTEDKATHTHLSLSRFTNIPGYMYVQGMENGGGGNTRFWGNPYHEIWGDVWC